MQDSDHYKKRYSFFTWNSGQFLVVWSFPIQCKMSIIPGSCSLSTDSNKPEDPSQFQNIVLPH